MTTDTNLYILILNNVLYLNDKRFKFKHVSSPLCFLYNSENEIPIHLSYSSNQTKSLCSKLQQVLNSEIRLSQNTPQSAFFGFPDNK